MPTHDIEIDERLLSPEAIRANSHHAMIESEQAGVFVAVKGIILHYLHFPVLITEIAEDVEGDDAIITLLHPDGRVEYVRYEVMQLLSESNAVHIGCEDAMDAFFMETGMLNQPPPTEVEATRQRAILTKLTNMLGGPSDGNWASFDDDDFVHLDVEMRIGDLKEARRSLGENIR